MRKFTIIASVIAALALQSVANAGYRSTIGVTVYRSTTSYAIGSVSTARYYTGDSSQYIGCSSSSDTVSSTYISCSARDASGNYVYCYTTSATDAARQAVASVNNTSYIYFLVNASGQCTYITIGNYSYYL
jgi:hypothetical protein